jgi:hypothetical protein
MNKQFGLILHVVIMSTLFRGTAYADDKVQDAVMVSDASQYLSHIAGEKGIGPREAATKSEKETADYIYQTLSEFGYDAERQVFTLSSKNKNEQRTSQNIVASKPGRSGKFLVLGAHYDSINEKGGSYGAIDNGASVAVLMTLAKHLSKAKALNDGVVFVAFGAEEIGLQGSKHFINALPSDKQNDYIGMINMDTIVGGDNLYIHSAHNKPYNCRGLPDNYKFDTRLRDRLLILSKSVLGDEGFELHPDYAEYPSGETGAWSDHAPFACAGMPIAYIEATNFSIDGKDGNDGYSQSVHPELWDCFDTGKATACNRKNEKQWGQIWHTKADRLELMNELFPSRIERQMQKSLQLLMAFLAD